MNDLSLASEHPKLIHADVFLSEANSSAGLNQERNAGQTVCFHCLEELPKYSNLFASIANKQQPMCCFGCKAAAEFISTRGLERFYEHRSRLSQEEFFGQVGRALSFPSGHKSSNWAFLDDEKNQQQYLIIDRAGQRRIKVLVDGLYCRSCGWLIERAINGVSSDCKVQIDVAARSMSLVLANSSIKMSDMLDTIEQLGYRPRVLSLGENDHSGESEKENYLRTIRRIAVAGFGMMQVMTYAVASYFSSTSSLAMDAQLERFLLLVSMLVATVVVFYSGRPFFSNALNDLRNSHLGMDVPIALAIAAAYFPSVAVVLMNLPAEVYFDSAVMFVFFLSLGRFVESRARHKLSGVGDGVQNILPAMVKVERSVDGKISCLELPPREILVSDSACLKANDVFAFDARLIEGSGQIDEALVTGEADPKTINVGDIVFAGSRLLTGSVKALAINEWSSSSIAKIQSSLDDAQRLDKDEKVFGELVSRYFVATVLTLTLVVAIGWLLVDSSRVFEVSLAMLIAACPCAFSLAMPLGRAAAINNLKKAGVLLTSNRALSRISAATLWCFDKTGTLTKGRPTVSHVVSLADISDNKCLQYVAAIEKNSSHVLSLPFQGIETEFEATNVFEAIGQGITAEIDGDSFFLGKPSWVIAAASVKEGKSEVQKTLQLIAQDSPQMLLARDDELIALIYIQDELRNSSAGFIQQLKSNKLQIALLSGDSPSNVNKVADALQVKERFADCLPQDKLAWIKSQQEAGHRVVMVGDGINDAPVLSSADVAVAMASGSDLAMQNADIVLLNGRLDQLAHVPAMAQRAKSITRQNLIWALIYNILALPLAALGLLTPWIAALGMSLSSLLVVLNATRIRTT